MAVYSTHEFHTFNWIDIPTSDRSAAKHFYGALLGWEFEDLLFPDGQIMYTMATLHGSNVAGMSDLMPEQIEAGIPAFWNSYVCVEDVRARLAECLELGAELLMDAIDILDSGSLAMFKEPNGALLSLWQPQQHIGMQIMHQTGAPCWFELDTNNVTASAEFYGAAFGWTTERDPENTAYTLFNRGGATSTDGNVGGMIKIMPEWGEVQPNWLVYFQVDNVDAGGTKAAELGGQALHDSMDFPNGRLITLMDPQGAVFGLMEMNQ